MYSDQQAKFEVLSSFVRVAKRRALQLVVDGEGIRDSFERAVDELLEEERPKIEPNVRKAIKPGDTATTHK